MYVIKRVEDGRYVSIAGSQSSYTPSLRRARTYTTREAADRDRCPENEFVVSVADEMPAPR